jgi:hypothetical protein
LICVLKQSKEAEYSLPFESKPGKAPAKIALRWRAIFVAGGLLGAAAFAAATMNSVAANDAGANLPAAATDTTRFTNDKNANNVRENARGARDGDTPDKPLGDAVGTIEGDAIALQGPMSVDLVNGQVKTMLRSGNDIRVKSGQAQIDLVEGGKIAICGPAHLSLLKSGGSLTIAIDTGVIHVHVEAGPPITVYTPQIQAKPIAIGDGAEDVLIGFDAKGVMCVRADNGAIRLENQLSGQSVIVPQGGDILLNNGTLEGISNTGGHCECEILVAKEALPPPEVSRIATPEEIRQRDAAKAAEAEAVKEAAENAASDRVAAEKAAADKLAADDAAARAAANRAATDNATTAKATAAQQAAARQAAAQQAAQQAAAQQAASQKVVAGNTVKPPVPWGEGAAPAPVQKKIETPKGTEPVYQVLMPPLSFDAKAAAPADNFDPKFIVLVRRVRVKPTLIFKGSVEGDTPVAKQVSDVKPVSTTATVGPAQPSKGNAAMPQNAKPAPPPDNSVVNRVRNYIRHLFS